MKFVYVGNPQDNFGGPESVVMKDAVNGKRYAFLKDGPAIDVGEIVKDDAAAKEGNYSLAQKLSTNSHFKRVGGDDESEETTDKKSSSSSNEPSYPQAAEPRKRGRFGRRNHDDTEETPEQDVD